MLNFYAEQNQDGRASVVSFGFPTPGGPPGYQPYPGGDPQEPSPAEAFSQLGLNDGIHPNGKGYRALIENALRQSLGALLKTNAAAQKL